MQIMKSILRPGSETRFEEGCGDDQRVPRNEITHIHLIKCERRGILGGEKMKMFATGDKICGFLDLLEEIVLLKSGMKMNFSAVGTVASIYS